MALDTAAQAEEAEEEQSLDSEAARDALMDAGGVEDLDDLGDDDDDGDDSGSDDSWARRNDEAAAREANEDFMRAFNIMQGDIRRRQRAGLHVSAVELQELAEMARELQKREDALE